MDAAAADPEQLVRAAQHAWRGAAHLHVRLLADRREQKHGVEGRDLEHADVGHAEQVGDVLDRLLRGPAARLLLRAPEQRDHRRLLAAFRILGDLLFRPGEVGLGEGEFLRLQLSRRETSYAHRSTSPNTMSIEPMMAETSASMWPRQSHSIAERCAKPGARILHLYGLLVPSATR